MFGKECPSDVGICCTVCQEGIPVPRSQGHMLTLLLSGKTSLINSIAGELDLDICVLILSSKGCAYSSSPIHSVNPGDSNRMCDNTLMKLMKKIPSR
jgi:hypothetical protein